MLRIFLSAIVVVCATWPVFPALAQNKTPAQQSPPAASQPTESQAERVRSLEAELADREAQNAVLIERVRELQAEPKSLVTNAARDLNQRFSELEQLLDSLVSKK
jgi:hypothetical protein